MRRFVFSTIAFLALAACTASPTTVQPCVNTSTRPSYTSAADSVSNQTTAEDRNGNTMGSGH